jgi:hypothetical protein
MNALVGSLRGIGAFARLRNMTDFGPDPSYSVVSAQIFILHDGAQRPWQLLAVSFRAYLAALVTMSTAIVAASSERLYAHAQVSAVMLDTTAMAC